jgi:glycine oxidase
VIGAGVIGLAVAWRAVRAGIDVIVVERDRIGGGTTAVAAGMLAPVSEAQPGEAEMLGLNVASAAEYPAFVAELAADTALDPGYLRCGTLRVARDSDEAAELDRALGLRAALKVPGRRLLASEARRLEPSLAPTLRLAAEFPDDHAIDPRALTAALGDALRARGGEIREHAEVGEIVADGGAVAGVRLADGTVIGAARAVIAAGVWSGAIQCVGGKRRYATETSHAGSALRPVKGQIISLRDPAGPGLLERVLRLERAYVVPRGDGRYVIGATMEERGMDRTVTAGAVFELLREVGEVLPGIADWIVEELAAGLRPGTADNAPLIGAGEPDGVYWATGHYRHGVLLAPITARLVTELLTGRPPAPELGSFAPGRFAPSAIVTGALR